MRETRRYSLVLPRDMFDQVKALADANQMTVIELLKRFIRLGLEVSQPDEGTQFIVRRRDGTEREVVLL